MTEFDYGQGLNLTDDQIAADAALLYPNAPTATSTSAEILQSGMRRFCPPGLRCCHAQWPSGLHAIVYFPKAQEQPSEDQLIAAFYMAHVLEHYEESEKGNWPWD